jgi:hypothetical protein
MADNGKTLSSSLHPALTSIIASSSIHNAGGHVDEENDLWIKK